ncbi:MAG TPA: N-6 DNA methylase [Acidobacteriaceae bacterium]
MKSKRRSTNEMEFQGQVVTWLNENISNHSGMGLDRATQEKPRSSSGKRNDLVVWHSRVSLIAFLSFELKTPDTPISDAVFLADAIEKAQQWGSPYFAIWNMQEAELYPTPLVGSTVTPSDRLYHWPPTTGCDSLEDWLKPEVGAHLKHQADEILDKAWNLSIHKGSVGVAIDAEIFVTRLSTTIHGLRGLLHREITIAAQKSRPLRNAIKKIAVEQGFLGFVEDVDFAVAGQMGYRLIGQILFYFALRRKQAALRPLSLSPGEQIPAALHPYWEDVRRYDYDALFKPHPLDSLVQIPQTGQLLIRTLIEQLAAYDWASLTDDVLGSVFERLIPREEQVLLGQFYTPRPVADLLAALTIEGERPLVLDPGCGSGTFLMSAYDFIGSRTQMRHQELLATIWGFDISPFAAELAAINLFRQNLSHFENFPRIVTGNFFDRSLGQTVEFPPPRVTSHGMSKIPIPIPIFDCIIGNPPYLRSQNQDDLDPMYRAQLFSAAGAAGVKAPPKTDLFAFFIYHAMRFMKPGSRLGFVTPSSWLTADYATTLQRLLTSDLRLVALVASSVESLFPQVDINAALLIAERVAPEAQLQDQTALRFVTLKSPIANILKGTGDYWKRVVQLTDRIYDPEESYEDMDLRIKIVPLSQERDALASEPKVTRNWSKYLRAPLSYYTLFGDVS